MEAQQLLKAGRLGEAISALNQHLRDNPGDLRARTSLFEALCFSGDYDRAEKHLDILQRDGEKDSLLGVLLYRAALAAERTRQEMFESKTYPKSPLDGSSGSAGGTLNGRPFRSISDADPRIGAKLEVFAGSDYLWIPLRDIAAIHAEPPKRLRDLLWIPAVLKTGPAFRSRELGEVLLPAISPLSWQHPDDEVRLGRLTEWCQDESGEVAPFGLKNLLVDGEEIPLLEVRDLEFGVAADRAAT
jgi:type VI secretion system protein ImpE